MATTLNRIINHKAAWHLIDAKGQVNCLFPISFRLSPIELNSEIPEP